MGYELNENKFLLQSITRACKLKHDRRITPRFPLKKGMLRMILDRFSEEYKNQPYLAKLYRGMAVAAYYGMLRVGEITKSPHNIKARNAHIADNKN